MLRLCREIVSCSGSATDAPKAKTHSEAFNHFDVGVSAIITATYTTITLWNMLDGQDETLMVFIFKHPLAMLGNPDSWECGDSEATMIVEPGSITLAALNETSRGFI